MDHTLHEINLPLIKATLQYDKSAILEAINKSASASVDTPTQKISRTDWFIPSEVVRPYYEAFEPVLYDAMDLISEVYGHPKSYLNPTNYWFQQYDHGDFHSWHAHGGSVFNVVYYVDVDDSTSRTVFRINGKEVSVPVKSGDILIFPSCLQHCSIPNRSSKIKTVIALNIDLN